MTASINLNNTAESVARALLAQIDGLGPKSVESIVDEYDEVKGLFSDPDRFDYDRVKGIGTKTGTHIRENLESWNLEQARDRLQKKQIGIISPVDSSYPESLAEIYDPPPALFYRGNLDTLDTVCVAIVGTRKADKRGTQFAKQLASGLADFGASVVSGQAAGIDGSAHKGALESENGSTVAVLGTGVDRVYPARHRSLQDKISSKGLLLSEYPPGSEPKSQHFPERNRIISGLSSAVIVVQAGERSGALITADSALEQGREVYAVPGDVNNSLHKGCHRLIKQGAGLVESPEDVIDYLQLDGEFIGPEREVTISSEMSNLLNLIKDRPIHIDELVNETEYDMGTCSKVLFDLEDKGLIHQLPGQRYQRTHDAAQLELNVE